MSSGNNMEKLSNKITNDINEKLNLELKTVDSFDMSELIKKELKKHYSNQLVNNSQLEACLDYSNPEEAAGAICVEYKFNNIRHVIVDLITIIKSYQ